MIERRLGRPRRDGGAGGGNGNRGEKVRRGGATEDEERRRDGEGRPSWTGRRGEGKTHIIKNKVDTKLRSKKKHFAILHDHAILELWKLVHSESFCRRDSIRGPYFKEILGQLGSRLHHVYVGNLPDFGPWKHVTQLQKYVAALPSKHGLAKKAMTLVVRWSLRRQLCGKSCYWKMKPCHWVRMLIGFMTVELGATAQDWTIDSVFASFFEWLRKFNWGEREMSFTGDNVSVQERVPPALGTVRQ